MGMAKGGWSKVDFDDNASFTSATEITGVMKDGTNFEPSTDVDELGDGTEGSAGKKLTGSVSSKDLSQAAFTELVAAEEAHTQLWFRFYHLKGASDYYTLKKCRVRVDHVPASAGKLHTRKVTISGYAAAETDLIGLTQS